MHKINNNDIIVQLKNQATQLITPNQRLAQAWQARYQQVQQATQQQVWTTPRIYAWNTWLNDTWQQRQQQHQHTLPTLLNPWQWQLLWQETLRQQLDKATPQIQALAQLAQQAWDLLQQWQIPLPFSPQWPLTPEEMAFEQWATQIQTILRDKNYIAPSQLTNQLIDAWETQNLTVPDTLILSGFDDFTPQQKALLSSLEEVGSTIYHETIEPQQTQLQLSTYTDLTAELTAAAQCLQQQLAQGAEKVACVIPNLAAIRGEVMTIFKRYFADVNISAGLALSDYPLVQTALSLLQLPTEKLTVLQQSQLLRSPYIKTAEKDFLTRHGLDARLREEGRLNLTDTPLNQGAISDFPHSQSAHGWVKTFAELLNNAGWPGERSLDSTEYQLHQRFKTVLHSLTQLDCLYPQLNYQQALHHLIQLCRQTVFQPQRRQDQIHVLGVLEAAGLEFDALWLAGLHAEQWPPIAQANPFIPKALQRQEQMPHATPERELAYCQQLMQRLTQAAPQVYLSYPQQDGGQHLHPSPLLKNTIEQQIQTQTNNQPKHYTPLPKATLDAYRDFRGPALNAEEKIRGGSFIFKAQAACPFQAFATIRLGACGLSPLPETLSALERGFLVHLALEHFWKTIKSHTQLCALNQTDYQAHINHAVEKALSNEALTPELKQLEHQRLTQLVNQWLSLEKNRPAFTVIACEQQHECDIAGLKIRLRLDRVDQTDNGDYVLIDYKTGKPSVYDWMGERLNEPQLPLYSITQAYPVNAIAFAQLHPRELRFKGLSADELHIDGISVSEYWTGQKQEWQTALTQLSLNFQQGVASIDPNHGAQTCRYCDLHGLCRIQELHHDA